MITHSDDAHHAREACGGIHLLQLDLGKGHSVGLEPLEKDIWHEELGVCEGGAVVHQTVAREVRVYVLALHQGSSDHRGREGGPVAIAPLELPEAGSAASGGAGGVPGFRCQVGIEGCKQRYGF